MRKILKLVTIISLVISSFPVGLLTDANETNAETAETVQTTTKTDGISEAEQSAKMDGTSETAQITKTDGTSETTQSVETAEIPKKVNRENFLDYFQLGGVSTYDKGTGIVTLTPNKSHQVGNVTLKQRFHSHTSFDLKGAIYLGDKLDSEGGADGIGFAIHPNAIGSVGYAGANLGIGGLPNAVGFKLDTFYNGKQTPDPNASDDVHKLGWDADPIRGQNNPFGAIVHTDAKGYVTTETKDVKLLDKKQVLNKAIKREETDGGYDALLAKGENEKGFVPIDFDYDSNSHILTVTFGVQKWQTKIDSAESLATSVSGSTGLFRNLQEFRFDSASYVKATNIKVNKVWKDNNNQDGIRPDSVLVNLLQNGKFFQSYSLKSSENWEHTFDNLVAEDLHGNKFTYSIEEASVPSGYTSSKEGNTIINTHPIKTTTVSGIKIWDDDNNHDGTRPDKITIHLMANGKEVNKKEVTAKDNWKYSFTDLPENEAGKAIKYTVKEDQVPGYETSYEGNNVVNKHPSAKTEVSGSKIWEDNNNQDGTRPDKITVHLMANDKEVDKKEVTAKDSWKYSFTDLPKNEAGKAIQYKIKEDQVPGYETSYEGNNVVNKHPSAKTEVSGAKIWEDNNDQDGTRPDRITVHLMANDKEVDKKDVTAKDNWKYSFTDLPKNEAGKAIQYRIKEDQVPGYETSYEGNNVVNKHPSAKTEVSGAKIWEDNNNQDGTRPDKITVHLMANDKEVNKKEITSKDNWKYSFTDLPKNEAGKAIKYTVKEDQVPGYEISYEGNNVVNKHPSAKTEVSGSKIWEDNNNQDGTRPDKITVHLMANDKEVDKKEVTAKDSWKYSFTDLPKNEAGKAIQYKIKEDQVPGYETSYEGNNVVNKHPSAKTEVSGAKIWEDNNDQDGTRPDRITVHLMANDKEVDKKEVTAKDNWKYSFTDLPKNEAGKAIQYRIKEDQVPGYETSYEGNNVVNKHPSAKTEVSGAKIWEDNNNQDGTRPDKITVHLMANDKEVNKKEITSKDNWKYSFTDLPKNEAGKAIKYTVKEDQVPGYETSYEGNNVVNKHPAAKTEVSGAKIWEDNNNQDGTRPDKITVHLMANDKEVNKKEITSKDNWKYSFTDLPKNEAGKAIKYTVKEDQVPGYEISYEGNNVVNKHPSAKTEVSGAKIWEDNNNQDGTRPDKITVHLMANDKEVDKKDVTAKDSWKYSFTDLPKNEASKAIKYTVKEDQVPGYEISYEGNNVVNKHPSAKTEVSGAKIWEDNNDQDGTRPTKITVHLMANDKEVDHKEVTGENGWKYSFTDLPKNEAGKAIKYTVKEDQVPGYETSYEGNNVVNKHPLAKTEVSGSKIWEDNNDQDGTRSDKITVHLMANDKEVDHKDVTAKDSWKYSFTDLPKNEAGKAIKYTVKEDQVPGYETSYEGNNVVNKHPLAKTEVSGSKIWEDNNDQDGTRPDKITVHLIANDKEVDKKEVTAKDSWKYSFTDLPKNEAGKAIKYTVKEDQVPGYETSYEGDNVVNKHPSAKTEVSGAKIWEDNNDQDGTRPTKITVHLMANEKEVDHKEVTGENGWKYSFTDLPKNEAGKAIQYKIKEDQVPGYETSYEGNNVVNKHPLAKTEVSGSKIWEDNNNQDGTRPDKITIHLMANDKEVDKKDVTAKDSWKYSFTDLPKNEAGKAIKYTVKEDQVPGYETSYEGNNVVNKHPSAKTEVSGAKIWEDNNNQDGTRPDKITIHLMANDKEVDKKDVTAKDSWKYSFTDLPKNEAGKAIKYTVKEDQVPGYETSYEGNNVVNKHPLAKTEVSGSKIWEDNNDQDGTRPDKITIHLMANDKEVNKKEITSKDSWKYSFTDLPKNEAGKAIKYTVKEDQVPGYETSYEGNNVVNKHPSAKTEVSGSKIWEDNNNQDGTRPDKITIHLMANDKEVNKKEITSKDNWKYSFTDLPKNEAGKVIKYTVKEDQVPGYETSYEGNNVVNKHPLAKTEVSGSKIWEDNNNQDGTRPDKITVHLMANDKEVDKKDVTAKDSWKYSFTDLPKNEAGKAIQYKIKEDQVPGYETSYEGNNVVNKHPSAKTEVSGAKIWEDNNNQDGTRPDKITVHLMANDKEVDKKDVTAKDSWKYSFTDLPKNEAGKAIQYKIKEDQVPGYETSYEGNNVVNKHPSAKTELSGSKIWEDNNNQDGTRPDKITIHLMANDKEVNKKDVTAKDSWKYSFTDLPKNKAGKAIQYKIKEDQVPGYETSYEGNNVVNKHPSAKTEVSGTKIWEDNNNQDGVRPNSITVNLLADGKKVDSKTVSEKEDWKYSFNVDKYKGGKAIKYTISEKAVPKYKTKVKGMNLINTYVSDHAKKDNNNLTNNKTNINTNHKNNNKNNNNKDLPKTGEIYNSLVVLYGMNLLLLSAIYILLNRKKYINTNKKE